MYVLGPRYPEFNLGGNTSDAILMQYLCNMLDTIVIVLMQYKPRTELGKAKEKQVMIHR